MIIIRMKPRAVLAAGAPARVSDVAHVMCDARLAAQDTLVPLPRESGVWLVDAGSVMSALYKQYPHEKINVLGDSIGWLQRLPGRGMKDQAHEWLRLMCCAVFSRICATPAAAPEEKRKVSGGDGSRVRRAKLSGKGGDTQ